MAGPSYLPSPSEGVWHVGALPIRAYALCILAGVVVAVYLAQRRWAGIGGAPGSVADLAAVGVPMGVVGGRIYHVITSPQRYVDHPEDIPKVWEGGLGIWGGVLLGVLAGVWFCRRRGWSWRGMMWACAPAIPVAQAIGRLGNWFNQELFGSPTTLPWGLRIDAAHRTDPRFATYHPTFLYELLWDLAVAALLIYVGRRWIKDGPRLVALYVATYSLGRLWIEALRVDDANLILGLRLNIWTSLAAIAAGTVFLLRTRERSSDDVPVAA
jgi:prolipoprotein diacylglyceryl transferase